jgi:signal transduction histidine kinase
VDVGVAPTRGARRLVKSWRTRLREWWRPVDVMATGAFAVPERFFEAYSRQRFGTWLILAVVIVVICAAQIGHQHVVDLIEDSEHAVDGRSALRLLAMGLVDAEAGQRGYLLSKRTEYLEPYRAAMIRLPQLLAKAQEALGSEPANHALLARVQKDFDAKRAEMALTIKLLDEGRHDYALALFESDVGRRRMDALRASVGELMGRQDEVIAMSRERLASSLLWLRVSLVVAVLGGALVLLVMLRRLRREAERERLEAIRLKEEQIRLDALVGERTRELSELASHFQAVQEDERASIARELHDELGAVLTAARMDVAWVKRRAAALTPEVDAKLTRAMSHLSDGITLKRRLIEGMVPSALTNLGVSPALEALVQETADRDSLRITCDLVDPMPGLSSQQALALYRTVQEAFTNIRKHARASHVRLTVARDGDVLVTRIEDDGVGLSVDGFAKLGSHGLRGMRHRMVALHGTMTVQNRAEGGMRLEARFPLTEPEAPGAALQAGSIVDADTPSAVT